MMYIYIIIEAIAALIAAIFIAIRTKKAEGVTYTRLDKVGRITNIILIPVYVLLAPLYMALGLFSYPNHEGFLGILGWIVSIFNASATLFCCLGLGFSVALRKKGKSKLSFAAQFAGMAAIVLTVAFYILFEGNLLASLN